MTGQKSETQKLKKQIEKRKAHKEKLSAFKRIQNNFSVMLAIFVVLLYCLLIAFKVIFLQKGVTPVDIIDTVTSDIIGALPALLFVDIISNSVLRGVSSDEISSHIASTLMGDLDVLEGFDADTRKNFVKSTLSSLTGEEDAEMVSGFLNPYLTGEYNTRKYENYYISVRSDTVSDEGPWKGVFTPDKYISIEESLQYIKHFGKPLNAAQECFPQDFYLAFCLLGKDVDEKFRDEECMFREYLFLSEEDMLSLCRRIVTPEDKIRFVNECLHLFVAVEDTDKENDESAEIQDVVFSESGIYIKYHSTHNAVCQNILFKLRFVMPQLIGHIEFVVQVGEPTFCPAFTFIYPKNSKLRTFLLMTGSEPIYAKNASVSETIWNMQLQDQWVYPMSGITFSLELPDEIMNRAREQQPLPTPEPEENCL